MAVPKGLDPGRAKRWSGGGTGGLQVSGRRQSDECQSPMTVHRSPAHGFVELRSRLKEYKQDLSSELRVIPVHRLLPAVWNGPR